MPLSITHVIVRELPIHDHRTGKPLVLTLEPGSKLIRIRVKRERRSYWVTLDQLWHLAASNRAAELRAERAARKQQRQLRREYGGV
jgi:hypothetical protein